MAKIQKITTFLWFDDNAEEAVRFYLSVFKGGRVLDRTYWDAGGPVPAGTLLTARFELAGQQFLALNGGPGFPFTEAISLFVDCETQKEVDRLWDALVAGGGSHSQCGWLKDRFGLSWQVAPRVLLEMLQDKDPVRRGRVMAAMMQMRKLDIAPLAAVYGEKPRRKVSAVKRRAPAKRSPKSRRR